MERSLFKLHKKDDGVIYKYVSYEIALKIIENHSLLYTNPDNFNDPFDLINYLVDFKPEKEEVDQFVTKFVRVEENKKVIVSNFIRDNLEWFSESFRDVLDNEKKNIGITCFSKSPIKTLMWSHYAEKHSGVCLGFSFENSAGDGLMQMAVNYTNIIQSMSFYKNRIDSFYNWLFTKSKVWEYEEEVRRLFINKVGLVEFRKEELCEIYYGLKMNSEKIGLIQKALKKYKYKPQKQSLMEIDIKTFDLKEKIIK